MVFQKLHLELGRLEDDPVDADLRRWIEEAIDCLPSVTAEPGERPHELYLYTLPGAPNEFKETNPVVLNVRHTMDALRLLWNEYRESLT